jgi:ribosome-associated protein
MKTKDLRAQVATAVHACQDKKATDISILQLDSQASGFTDFFVICSGSNPRQIQAIADDVDDRLSAQGLNPTHREGYNQAEWVLLDYVDFVVHIFSEQARKFYDLERLWKTAKRLELPDLEKPVRKTAAKEPIARKTGAKSAKRAANTRTAAKKRSGSRKP